MRDMSAEQPVPVAEKGMRRAHVVNNTLIRDSGRRRAALGGDMAVVWEAC